MNLPLVRWVNARTLGRDVAGGKAAGLSFLLQYDLPVPPAFVIPSYVFTRTLGNTASLLEERIASISLTSEPDYLIQELRDSITERPMDQALSEAVASAYETMCTTLGHATVAVRSSATEEDGIHASHAGQYETFLGINGVTQLMDAIFDCWASLYNDRAISYRLNRVNHHPSPAMAVVVQLMVDARAAGVFVTNNPQTGSSSEILVESVFGLGAPLVAGSVTPDLFIINKRSGAIEAERITSKATFLTLDSSGCVVNKPVPTGISAKPSLVRSDFEQIINITRILRPHLKLPSQVEFAVDPTGQVQLLQIRPMIGLKQPSQHLSGSGSQILEAVLKASRNESLP